MYILMQTNLSDPSHFGQKHSYPDTSLFCQILQNRGVSAHQFYMYIIKMREFQDFFLFFYNFASLFQHAPQKPFYRI